MFEGKTGSCRARFGPGSHLLRFPSVLLISRPPPPPPPPQNKKKNKKKKTKHILPQPHTHTQLTQIAYKIHLKKQQNKTTNFVVLVVTRAQIAGTMI